MEIKVELKKELPLNKGDLIKIIRTDGRKNGIGLIADTELIVLNRDIPYNETSCHYEDILSMVNEGIESGKYRRFPKGTRIILTQE